MGERPTNEQVWKFYLEVDEDSEDVRKYLATVEEHASSNLYLELYDDFRMLERGLSQDVKDPADASFYGYLHKGRNRPLEGLCPDGAIIPSESGVADLEWALNLATFPDKSGRLIPSPKWHLYISWFALKAYRELKGQEQWDWNVGFNRCIRNRVLRLWMAEGAIKRGASLTIGRGDDDIPTKEGIPLMGEILDAIPH